MNFHLNDEQMALANTLSRFVADRYDLQQRDRYRRLEDGYDPSVWGELAGLGLISLVLPEAAGGLGGGRVDLLAALGALGPGLLLDPWLPALAASTLLATLGTARQKERWLTRVSSGETTLAIAVSEAGRDHPLQGGTARAERTAGAYRLTGQKRAVLGATAEAFLVPAVNREQGLSLFVVPAHSSGLSLRHYRAIDGSVVCDLTLDGCSVGDDLRLGDGSGVFAALEDTVALACFAVAAEAVGIMDSMIGKTVEHLRVRKQFGASLSTFQAIQHRMADAAAQFELARCLVMKAAIVGDDALAGREERLIAAFGAKALVSQVAIQVAEEAVQFHGAIGITEELWVGRAMKRLLMIAALFGDARAQSVWCDTLRTRSAA